MLVGSEGRGPQPPRARLKRLTREVARHILSAAIIAGIVFIERRVVPVNATTAALSFLIAVLAAATVWGLSAAITTSIAAVFAFNFFFLPPIGTLTIQDPQNWVALSAFLVTAIIASQLSARAQRRAAEAQRGRQEMQRLYELGRAILVHENIEALVQQALNDVVRLFRLRAARFLGLDQHREESTSPLSSDQREQMARVARSGEVIETNDERIVPVRLGGKAIGSLALEDNGTISSTAADAVANLLAIAIERKTAMRKAAAGEAARQSEELRAVLLDGLAHDLKTPLTGIKASITTLLGREDEFDANTREFLDIISEETERLHRTVSEAIETARIESGTLKLNRGRHDLRDLLDEIFRQKKQYAERIVWAPQAEPLRASIDWDLMKLALRQIVDNAVKYSPDDMPIELHAGRENSHVDIFVDDYGPGVAADEEDKIFRKFYRGRAGRQIAGGSGLGLAVAKRIIEAHGGAITAHARPKRGTRFCVQIPIEPK